MADLIENPMINLPFAEPQRHFRFASNGIPMDGYLRVRLDRE
ncbi:MAG: hypothetical protein ACOYMW_14860 [Candidatus Competibacteraceae bacterium]